MENYHKLFQFFIISLFLFIFHFGVNYFIAQQFQLFTPLTQPLIHLTLMEAVVMAAAAGNGGEEQLRNMIIAEFGIPKRCT